jgi:hypothetical protein
MYIIYCIISYGKNKFVAVSLESHTSEHYSSIISYGTTAAEYGELSHFHKSLDSHSHKSILNPMYLIHNFGMNLNLCVNPTESITVYF